MDSVEVMFDATNMKGQVSRKKTNKTVLSTY